MPFVRKKYTLILDTIENDLVPKIKYIKKKGKMTQKEKKQIDFMLKYITNNKSNLSPNDLNWAIKMEDAYHKFGKLTVLQFKLLQSIFGRV
jgi:hypothetical protein